MMQKYCNGNWTIVFDEELKEFSSLRYKDEWNKIRFDSSRDFKALKELIYEIEKQNLP